ncbi:MAG TPA: hypothetical protein VNT22_10555 [Baekduia sp.]|nr:hypothetical protein [Baekduia sp.]
MRGLRSVVLGTLVLCALAAYPVGTGAAAAPPLSKAEAGKIVREALSDEFGSRYKARSGYRSTCTRRSSARFRCAVSWNAKGYSYKGSVTVWLAADDTADPWNWKTAVHRHHVSAPAEDNKPAPPSSNCDPNYSGACLDPNASDYDCSGGSGNGPKYTGTVTVVGSDHYDLDADGDGTGCE